jgi:glycosyltransferase involved in cell wall biosynthesis
MKVLAVTNMYPTAAEPWFGCFVRDQVEDLRALGLEVDVLPFDGRRDRLEYARAARRLRSLVARRPFDVVHAHYGLTGAVALTQNRAPVVTTFHGSDTGYVRWQAWVSRVVARSAHAIFVHEGGATRIGANRATVIPSSVDTELFTPRDRCEARRALGWEEARRYVLFPSAPGNPVKRYDLFERTLRRVRALAPSVDAVNLEGFSREETALVMNAVDAVLLTSDSEGSPVTVKEALACETPVVSVPVGDVPSVLAGLAACTVARRDSDALAEAVLRALNATRSPDLRARAEEFARPRIAERVAAVYEQVARRNGT